jgi:hypothetical protein
MNVAAMTKHERAIAVSMASMNFGGIDPTGYRHRCGLEEGKKTSDFNIDSIKYTNTAKKIPPCTSVQKTQ